MNVRAITDTILIADQPEVDELSALPGQGYVGVINLRNDGEPEQPLTTAAEGDLVRSVGLDYHHLGVGSLPLTPDGVNAVREFLDRNTPRGKVLVHCRRGGRAAALVLLHLALRNGWTGPQALDQAAPLGLAVDGGLRTLVERYLDDHGVGRAPTT
jgi:uncharacterized protein (TIGR01244 family)